MSKIYLTDNWKFKKENGEFSIVSIPHDAMIYEERGTCLNGANSGYFPGGKYTYEKEIEIAKDQLGKYIAIFFEGVYRNTNIYLNDEKVGFHAYGYSEFEVDITSKAKEGTNTIRVEVDNSLEPNSRWYSGSGIYRPVSLIIKELDHIRNLKVKTVSINPATINVSLDNDDATVEIYDGDTLVSKTSKGDIVIENAKLWDDITPNLYKIVVRTNNDEETLNFGIRELKYSPKTGVLVNGREVKFRGSCIHHDNGILGACDYKDASDRRIRLLKEHGYNAIRSAHNPCSRFILDACDKYGVYVMDESFDMWYIPKTYHDYSRNFYENYEDDLCAMVSKDYNHPSVVMYSLGNENSEPGKEEGLKLLKTQSDFVKSLDDTRIITIGANLAIMRYSLYKDEGDYKPVSSNDVKDKMAKLDKKGSAGFNFVMGLLPKVMTNLIKGKKYGEIADNVTKHVDILGLNYGTVRYEIDLKREPNRMMVGSETFNAQIVRNWNLVNKYHQVVGDFCWTGWDYLGEAGTCGAFDYIKWEGKSIADGAGAIDLIGNPTPINYYMQIAYGTYTKPYIAVSPISYNKEKYLKGGWRMNNYLHSWSWDNYEGEKAIVEVYSSAYKVKLLLNDKVIGEKKTKENIAKFKVSYASGSLKAIALDEKGNNVGEDVLVSASKEAMISLKADKTILEANNVDLCHLNIDLTDENGIIKSEREDVISIELEGNSIVLAGLGTARTKIKGSYNTNTSFVHFGRALAVFKATNNKGVTKVIVKANGLTSKEIEITCK